MECYTTHFRGWGKIFFAAYHAPLLQFLPSFLKSCIFCLLLARAYEGCNKGTNCNEGERRVSTSMWELIYHVRRNHQYGLHLDTVTFIARYELKIQKSDVICNRTRVRCVQSARHTIVPGRPDLGKYCKLNIFSG